MNVRAARLARATVACNRALLVFAVGVGLQPARVSVWLSTSSEENA